MRVINDIQLEECLEDSRVPLRKAKEAKLTYEKASRRFYVEDGELRYKEVPSGRGFQSLTVGGLVGTIGAGGYKTVSYNNVNYLVHRVIWLLVKGVWPADQLDHVDKNRLNNRVENLREASNRSNHHNRTDNTTGFVGVTYDKSRGKYIAGYRVGYTRVNVGRFDTAELAYRAKLRHMEMNSAIDAAAKTVLKSGEFI